MSTLFASIKLVVNFVINMRVKGLLFIIKYEGSNPMDKEALSYIKQHGTVVFLDVKITDILKRLAEMKVNRIVGQERDSSMKDILRFRQQYYEGFVFLFLFVALANFTF